MKKNQLFKVITLVLFTICLQIKMYAQATGSCTVLKQTCKNDGVLAINIASGLTPPLTFTYSDYNYNQVIHSNVNSLNDTLFGISQPITYVYVTNSTGGSSSYMNQNIGMNAPFQVDNPITTNAVCPSLTGTAHLTINGGTAPASVKWYQNGGYQVPNMYIGTDNPINLSPGAYSALLTDGNGCQVMIVDSSILIRNISNITASVATTDANCINGTATVNNPSGGTAPYTYHWSNGANTKSINNLILGYYSVTVADVYGCNVILNTYVQQSQTINVNTTATPATCLQNDGSIISFGSGGTPPYTYLYDNGVAEQTASGISGYTYMRVTATDANGCTGEGGAYINSSSPITVTYTTTTSSCTAPTGSAGLAITGGTTPYAIKWNTSPELSGVSIHNMSEGFYAFTVTDAVGCVETGTVYIQPQSWMSASANSSTPFCPATTGDVNVSVSGDHPPFTYLWNTGATTSSISSTPLGNYSCVITDNAGCSKTKSTYLSSSSPINIGLNATPSSCIYAHNGTAYANATGGTAPYTYNWSNNKTGTSISGLGTGNYYVSVQDANGCSQYSQTFVDYDGSNTSCYCTLTGKVYVDLNNNCQFDSGEQGVEHIMIHCSEFGYSFTNANGDYSFLVPTGSYTLSESVQYAYPLASCQNNSIAVSVTAASACTSTVNFANTAITIHDIHIIETSINNAIPGNSYTQGLIVQNDGTVTESNIQLGKKHDGQLQYVSSSPNVYTQLKPTIEPNWYSVKSAFPALSAGASTIVYSDYLVPTNIPLGTNVNFWDTAAYASPMTNWLNDYTPWNNIDNYDVEIIGSFDPNFKEVNPKGTDVEGYISTSDSVLDYIVHFQNTGSYYAQKVVVVDTLDAHLDFNSLRLGYSDHKYTASLNEKGILKITFNNINLNWQSNNELTSRGLVTYSIKQKQNLSPGTKIKKSAAIYFDYNAPVITNQALNTIQLSTDIKETKVSLNVSIYPNPASSELNIIVNDASDLSAINIYDLQGRLLQNQKVTTHATLQKIDISSFVNGIYFVELKENDGRRSTAKFIKN